MEACFLNSRSFCSIKELVPSIELQIFSCPKRDSNQFWRRKSSSLSSITSCQLDSWTPMDDEHTNNQNLIADSDWRTFRARLVAGEFAPRPEKLDTIPTRPPVPIGKKWAHMIHEPEKGCLLIATEKLDGVHIFERAAILLISVGPTSLIGIILNRPSLMSIKETKSTGLDVAGTFSDKRLFFGGPLEEGLFLVSPKEGNDDVVARSGVFREVMKGLYYGTRERVGLASEMVRRGLIGTSEFRFFDGYCEWDKEQLRDEVLGGCWTLAACSASVLGSGGCVISHGLCDEILGLIGIKQVL